MSTYSALTAVPTLRDVEPTERLAINDRATELQRSDSLLTRLEATICAMAEFGYRFECACDR